MRDLGGRDTAAGDLLLLVGCLVVALIAYSLPAPWAASLVGTIRGTALRPVVALQARAAQDRTSRFLLDDIRAERDSLALLAMADSSVRLQNHELRRLLGLKEQRLPQWIAAAVLHRPTPTDSRMLLIDAGTDRGIAEFQPVLTPDGLLGTVWSTSPSSASVLTWMHPDWRASAVTADGATLGILAPAMVGNSQVPLLELRGVALRDSITSGSIVYTSGLGGVYPAMVPVGRVVGVADDPLGYERLYRVAPFVNPGLASQVMVLTSQSDTFAIRPAPADGPR